MHQGIMSHQLGGHSCFNGVFKPFLIILWDFM